MTYKRGVDALRQASVAVPATGRVRTDASAAALLPPPDLVTPTRAGRAARHRGAILRRLLALADLAGLISGVAVGYLAVVGTGPDALLWAFAFGPVWILVAKLHGLYDRDHRRIRHSTLDELPALISASVIATVIVGVLAHLLPSPDLTDGAMIALALTAFTVGATLRGITRHLWHTRRPPENSALVGSGLAMQRLMRRIETHPEVHLSVLGYFGESATPGSNGAGDERLARLGSVQEVVAVADQRGIEHIVVVDGSISADELSLLIGDCKQYGLSLTLVAPHASLLGPGIQLNRVGELPLLDFGFSDPPRSTELLKRAIDCVSSAVLLVALAPLLLAVAIAIKLDSRGPVLFKQTRIGKGGRSFTMLKFRTMVVDAEDRVDEVVDTRALAEPSFKVPDDPRRTRVGRRLRRFSLDELPQLWNVFRGEMSLVGPRPEEQPLVQLYDERQRVRLSVKPGMTGPMQVYGRGDLTFEERLALERDYIDNLSIAQDVAILLRTPRAVIGGNGAY